MVVKAMVLFRPQWEFPKIRCSILGVPIIGIKYIEVYIGVPMSREMRFALVCGEAPKRVQQPRALH